MRRITKFLSIGLCGLLVFIIGIVLLFGYQDIPLDELKSKYTGVSSSFIAVNGMDVHYRDEGPKNALTIVLIHGTGSSLHTFDAWAKVLKQDYRVIRLDLPGYGLTGPFPNRNYTINNYVEFLNSFMSQIAIDKCVLAGNSLGGSIAWNYTIKYPNMVDKLILIDASGYPTVAKSEPVAFKLAKIPLIKNIFTYVTPKFVAEKSVKNVYANKTKVSQELVNRYFELTLREGNRQAFVDRLGVEKNPNSWKAISTIEQPTLVLWGDRDELIPVDNAFRFQNDLPNATLVVLKNVGHVPMEEAPELSLEPTKTFLEN